MIEIIFSDQLVHCVDVAVINLFVKAPYQSLVRFGRHGMLL